MERQASPHLARLTAFLGLVLAGAPTQAGIETWTVAGAPSGGIVNRTVIDPIHPSTLYALANQQIFKSTDSGAHWTQVLSEPIEQPYDIAIDPLAPSTLYVGTGNGGGVLKSTDGGATWKPMNTGMGTIFSGSQVDLVFRITADPTTEGTVYAITTNTGVYKTTDGGKHWNAINTGLSNPISQLADFSAVTVDPANASMLYLPISQAGFQGGIYESTDGGAHWTQSVGGNATEVVVDPADHTRVYAVDSNSVYLSTDTGSTWNQIPTTPLTVSVLRVDPLTSSHLLAGSFGAGLYQSTDSGAHWSVAIANKFTIYDVTFDPVTSTNVYISNVGGIYKSVDGGATMAESDAGLHGRGSQTLYIGGSGTMYAGSGNSGLLMSSDHGATWTEIDNGLAGSVGFIGIRAVVEDPVTPTTIYMATSDGLYQSLDKGAHWTLLNNGLTQTDTYGVAVDPRNTLTLYAGSFSAGTFKSIDGGASWNPCGTGGPMDITSALMVDPANSQVIYAGGGSSGLFISSDGCGSWVKAAGGLPSGGLSAMAMDPTNAKNLYAALLSGGIYKSTDGGSSWTAIDTGLFISQFYDSIAIDPLLPSRLYAAQITVGPGVYLSTDSGAHWSALPATPTGSVIPGGLAVDPSTPALVYGSAQDGQIYVYSAPAPAVQDASLQVNENTATNGMLTADSTGVAGPVSFALATHPAHGTLTLVSASKGSFTYTPTAGYTGSDGFTFTASAASVVSAPATVSISVTSPTAGGGGSSGGGGGGALSLLPGLLLGLLAWFRRALPRRS